MSYQDQLLIQIDELEGWTVKIWVTQTSGKTEVIRLGNPPERVEPIVEVIRAAAEAYYKRSGAEPGLGGDRRRGSE